MKSKDHIESYLKELHSAGLMTVTRGNKHSSRISMSG
jgi:hypothetical protein